MDTMAFMKATSSHLAEENVKSLEGLLELHEMETGRKGTGSCVTDVSPYSQYN